MVSHRGVVFMALFTFAVFAVDVLFAPCALLLLVPVRAVVVARRRYIALVTRFFSEFAMDLIQRVCGTKIFVYSSDTSGDFLHEPVGPLVISNHRTRVDWLYCFWWYGAYIHMGEYMRVVLKDALRSVPFYGWAMQMSMYIFLQRSRDADVPHIYNVMSYLLKTSKKVSTLIFPEGTDLSESNVRKSNQYASERGLPEYRYVLYPKPTGFMTCADAVRNFHPATGGSGSAERCYVHDLTLAFKDYEPGERPNEKSLLLGRLPKEVHIVVDRIPLDDVPSGRADMDKWLRSRFERKERLLRACYEGGAAAPASLRLLPHTPPPGNAAKSEDDKLLPEAWPPLVTAKRPTDYFKVGLFSAFQLALFFGLLFSSVVRWGCALIIISYVVVSAFKGYDHLELTLHGPHTLHNQVGRSGGYHSAGGVQEQASSSSSSSSSSSAAMGGSRGKND